MSNLISEIHLSGPYIVKPPMCYIIEKTGVSENEENMLIVVPEKSITACETRFCLCNWFTGPETMGSRHHITFVLALLRSSVPGFSPSHIFFLLFSMGAEGTR